MRAKDNNQPAEKWLDAALKQYGETEPRPGLENRILANLYAEQTRAASQPWQWRPVAAVFTIAVLAAGAWWLRRKPDITPATTATHLPVAIGNTQPDQPIASTARPPAVLKPRGAARPQSHITRAAWEPRLEQFPAPAPLSDQEQMLAQYVREHRRQATMVARARAELLKTELLRFQQAPGTSELEDSEQ